ncbi:Spermine/spermidine synthase [Streptomyces sp. DvalAA-14]|uniref:spermidine synthase n=1 Tax=unclassified Streptomyces TaxID=2593676 RepID=UPI00081B83A1|nr:MULTISPECIES: fused MFS/spermidine synthase [unclassified Streptomyces]MYS23491.1 methyltransferase domain-containing protein [Streptomyces sp. SID4948]SCE34105.1 Spermine/spermidine synthase [Streptomyces sp. DvalAA-14]
MARTRRAPETRTAPVDSGLAELQADPDRAQAWTLLVDGAPQSLVDLADPAYLGFSYQRRLGHVVDLVAPAGAPVQVVHLGGGALTMARYTAHTRPRSTQTVVELDTALTELVRRELPWDRNWRIKVRGGDARAGLAKLPDASAHLVIADAFTGARTPAHLTTLEFLHEVRRVLRPDGHYAVNLTDGGPLGFARGQSATVGAAFAEVVLAAEPAVLRGKRFGNLMLWAAAQPLPLPAFTRLLATDPHQSRTVHGPALTAFTAGAAAVTDATATASPEPPEHAFG